MDHRRQHRLGSHRQDLQGCEHGPVISFNDRTSHDNMASVESASHGGLNFGLYLQRRSGCPFEPEQVLLNVDLST